MGLAAVRWPKDLSLDASAGSIYDFHEVPFLTYSGILRIQPILQAEAIAVNITCNVDLRYVAQAVGERRWKLHTQHRNSLLWSYADTRQPAGDILGPRMVLDVTALANEQWPYPPAA